MDMTRFSKSVLRGALIVLSAGLGIGMAAAIAAKVKAKMMGDDRLKKSDIDVTTTNGVVTLKVAAR